MFLNRNGEKVYSLPVIEEFVDVEGDEFSVEEIYTVEVCDNETDAVILTETFYDYPKKEQLKWCLWKGMRTAAKGTDVYAKVSKRYRLVM